MVYVLVRFVLGMLEHIFGPHSFRQTIQYFMSSKYVYNLNTKPTILSSIFSLNNCSFDNT